MSGLMDKIFSKAKQLNKHIVLPEGEEPRIIEAAKKIARLKLARLTLIGDKDKIIKKTGELDGINIINPEVSPKTNTYAEHLSNEKVRDFYGASQSCRSLIFWCLWSRTVTPTEW